MLSQAAQSQRPGHLVVLAVSSTLDTAECCLPAVRCCMLTAQQPTAVLLAPSRCLLEHCWSTLGGRWQQHTGR